MSKKKAQKQTKADSQKTVKSHVDNMLDSMHKATKDFTSRQQAASESYEESKLAAKQKADSRNTHAYKTKTDFRKSTIAKQSRRAIVIDLLHEAKHTKAQIASLLVSKFDIADNANNKKCVSGTMYDLQNNSTCNFKTDKETDIISCVSTTCKYKH